MKNEKTLLKNLQMLSFCILFCSFSGVVVAAEKPKSRSAQKIAKLKSELNAAKGQKRAKLIKKIAEMENKVLEHKLQSFR